MPRFDGTGPMGWGPGTGRALGFCGFPPRATAFFGRGCGRGLGRALGFSRWWGSQTAVSKDAIKNEIAFLEERLSELKDLLAEGAEDKE